MFNLGVPLGHRSRYHAELVLFLHSYMNITKAKILPKLFKKMFDECGIPMKGNKGLSSIFQRIELLSALLLTITLCNILSNQPALAVSPNSNGISRLRAEALEADGNGEYDKAESLYQKALTAAKQSDSKMKVLEFLSRIVQVRIENHKLLETHSIVQEAIQIALSLKKSNESDSTLPVWMNDMADAFYSKGEQTARDDLKEYCLKEYSNIKLTMDDQFDYQVLGRANLLTSYLQHHGRYLEALPYAENACSYEQRTKPNDLAANFGACFGLVVAYLLSNNPIKAELALNQASALQQKYSKDPSQQAMLTEALGNVRLEQGDFKTATALYQQALRVNEQYIGKPAIAIGNSELSLGLLEQNLGHRDEARQYLQASLDCYEKCSPPEVDSVNRSLHVDGLLYSGQVIAAEHLAQIATQQGNLPLAHSLQVKAKKIRAQNPHWSACKNPDPDRYHLMWRHLPFPVEMIPTRSDLPL